MTTDPAVLLAFVAGALLAPFVGLAYWLWVDAKDRAEIRRHEAEMAALGTLTHRLHQDRGRYLTDDANRPE